jgi:hypothetical protein
MTALEQLAQAILDGRVELVVHHHEWDNKLSHVSIHVEPATEQPTD